VTLVARDNQTFDLIALGKASDPPLETAFNADTLCLATQHFNEGQP
jgi:hypothetical protein